MYKFEEINNTTKKIIVDLDTLYLNNQQGRERFESHWDDFYQSDKFNREIIGRNNCSVWYLYEEIIPEIKTSKPHALLLFGNPAPHSVNQKTFFAYEGTGAEHRVWKVLRDVGLLSFENSGSKNDNKRKDMILQGQYQSPFHLALLPFMSLPTTPSAPPWTGVAGIYKLFGSKAMESIIKMEQERLHNNIVKLFGDKKGVIVAFQKDAYIYSTSKESDQYNFKILLKRPLKGTYRLRNNISVITAPPSRFMQGNKAKATLKKSIFEITSSIY